MPIIAVLGADFPFVVYSFHHFVAQTGRIREITSYVLAVMPLVHGVGVAGRDILPGLSIQNHAEGAFIWEFRLKNHIDHSLSAGSLVEIVECCHITAVLVGHRSVFEMYPGAIDTLSSKPAALPSRDVCSLTS